MKCSAQARAYVPGKRRYTEFNTNILHRRQKVIRMSKSKSKTRTVPTSRPAAVPVVVRQAVSARATSRGVSPLQVPLVTLRTTAHQGPRCRWELARAHSVRARRSRISRRGRRADCSMYRRASSLRLAWRRGRRSRRCQTAAARPTDRRS